MKTPFHPSFGLVGRILAIVLLTLIIEFCASTVLYDRASRLRVREDEAHRVSEHLATASRIVMQARAEDRPAVAARLSTKNFLVRWQPMAPPAPPMSADLRDMREQVIQWEPVLNDHDLRLYLKTPGPRAIVTGSLQLADGSWLSFKAPQLVDGAKFRYGWLAMMAAMALGLSLIAWLLIRWILLPVRTLAKAATRIGHGAIETIPEQGGEEVRGLIRAFNDMQARIHSLIADRVEALAAVGHDLRTPLSRLQLRAETIQDDQLRQAVADDVREMGGMVSSLLAYLGGEDDPEPAQRVDLAVMAATLIDEVNDLGGDARYEGPEHLDHHIRPVGFKRALRNIVENAVKYGGGLVLSLQQRPDMLLLIADDDGPGIDEDRIEDVLRPFVRLDAARARSTKGLGLGLAIAVRAVAREGGTLSLENRASGGLRVCIELPRSSGQT